MENINFLENLATRLGQNATVKNVYGEPVVAGDKTIIPVAEVMYGFGGGYGYGKRKPVAGAQQNENDKAKTGEGLGGGGGVLARPKGVYEISKNGTRYIPANYRRQIIAAVLIGIMIISLMAKMRK